MKRKIIFILIACFTLGAAAEPAAKKMACMAGAAADIDGRRSFTTDASSIRFILSLEMNGRKISAVEIKHTGVMQGMPSQYFDCSTNEAESLFTCVSGAQVVWYYPEKAHGVIASIGMIPMFKENRANSAGMYNYSCSPF